MSNTVLRFSATYLRPIEEGEFEATPVLRGSCRILRDLYAMQKALHHMGHSVQHGVGAELLNIRSLLTDRMKALKDGEWIKEVLVVAVGAHNKQFVPVFQVPDEDRDFFAALRAGDACAVIRHFRNSVVGRSATPTIDGAAGGVESSAVH